MYNIIHKKNHWGIWGQSKVNINKAYIGYFKQFPYFKKCMWIKQYLIVYLFSAFVCVYCYCFPLLVCMAKIKIW